MKICIDLLGSFHIGFDSLAVLQVNSTRVRINHKRRVHKLAMILHQPIGAVEVAAFFIRRKRQNQVAPGLVALAMQPQKGRNQRGIGVLHVLRAAPVIITILLDKLERVGMPVLGQRLDNIHVAEKEHWLVRARSMNAYNEILLARIRPQQMHIVCRKARIQKSLLHRRGGRRHIAQRCVRRVDLDKLLENRKSRSAIRRRSRRDHRSFCQSKRAAQHCPGDSQRSKRTKDGNLHAPIVFGQYPAQSEPTWEQSTQKVSKGIYFC